MQRQAPRPALHLQAVQRISTVHNRVKVSLLTPQVRRPRITPQALTLNQIPRPQQILPKAKLKLALSVVAQATLSQTLSPQLAPPKAKLKLALLVRSQAPSQTRIAPVWFLKILELRARIAVSVLIQTVPIKITQLQLTEPKFKLIKLKIALQLNPTVQILLTKI